MQTKTGLNLINNYSYNFSVPARSKKSIKFIIIHYTGMKRENEAVKKLCDSKSKVSSHYFIKKNGDVLKLVPELYEAWHAGKSKWKNFKSLNKYSIGIEIQNPGHSHGYKNFTSKQISSLKILLKYLIKIYGVKLNNILGHSDVAPNRKKDPGEKFPWSILAKNKLSYWHNLSKKKIKKLRKVKVSAKDEYLFLKNLYKIGYKKNNMIKSNKNQIFIVKAFQRRFRQDLVNGKIDNECFIISKNLIKLS